MSPGSHRALGQDVAMQRQGRGAPGGHDQLTVTSAALAVVGRARAQPGGSVWEVMLLAGHNSWDSISREPGNPILALWHVDGGAEQAKPWPVSSL